MLLLKLIFIRTKALLQHPDLEIWSQAYPILKKRLDRIYLLMLTGSLVGVLGSLFAVKTLPDDSAVNVLLSGFIVLFFIAAALALTGVLFTRLSRVCPLKHSDEGCARALELVSRSTQACAYRDHVISEGRELLLVDLVCMSELAAQQFAAEIAATAKLKYARADALLVEAQFLRALKNRIAVYAGAGLASLLAFTYWLSPGFEAFVALVFSCAVFSFFAYIIAPGAARVEYMRPVWLSWLGAHKLDGLAALGGVGWQFLQDKLESGQSLVMADIEEARRRNTADERNKLCGQLHKVAQ